MQILIYKRNVLNLNPLFNGPFINFYDCNQFSKPVFNKFILKTNAADNCCSLKDESIIIICNFIDYNDGIVVIGTKYKTLSNFYVTMQIIKIIGI